jgi:hypothetical protein
MDTKYYTKGILKFKPNPESNIGLYVGDHIVRILTLLPFTNKFKIQFNNGDKIITDMVTPIDLYINEHLISKKSEKLFLFENGNIGEQFHYRLRACNNGNKTLTIKKNSIKNRKTLYIEESGEWFIPPRYNFVLGYID